MEQPNVHPLPSAAAPPTRRGLFDGGRVVLCGAGMYVNHALAVGLDGPLTEAVWRTFEQRCAAVGVEPAFEVSPASAGEVVARLVDRGYALDDARAAMLRQLTGVESLPAPDPRFVIEPATGKRVRRAGPPRHPADQPLAACSRI